MEELPIDCVEYLPEHNENELFNENQDFSQT